MNTIHTHEYWDLLKKKMETRLPMLHCLLQHSLRNLCAKDSISNSWVYAVFWRMIPRNFPPPRCEYGGSLLDRAKGGNKRNWILVWEDGFCDFAACERAANGVDRGKVRFGADIFFKMSHEVYNFGEGLVGKVASDNTHKLVYNDSQAHIDNRSSWNASLDPPRAWEAQFISGIETIAVISVREGVVQLGSFDKVAEDVNFVMSIQTKFNYLYSMYTLQRPFGSILNYSSNMFMVDYSNCFMGMMQKDDNEDDDIPNMVRSKRIKLNQNEVDPQSKIVYSSSAQNRVVGKLPLYSIPPLLPSVDSNLGAFLRKINANPVCGYDGEAIFDNHKRGHNKSLVDEDTQRMGPEIEEKVQAKTHELVTDED